MNILQERNDAFLRLAKIERNLFYDRHSSKATRIGPSLSDWQELVMAYKELNQYLYPTEKVAGIGIMTEDRKLKGIRQSHTCYLLVVVYESEDIDQTIVDLTCHPARRLIDFVSLVPK